jgi:hypothetical protein
MNTIHIVGLKNDEITSRNIRIGVDHQTWGMKDKGKHVDIKSRDYVLFLIGLSIKNIEEIKKAPELANSVFPNLTDKLLEQTHLIQNYVFDVEQVIFGEVTSDYYFDDSELWPPKVSKAGKTNYFPNRFRWRKTYEGLNVVFDKKIAGEQFLADIIRAFRGNGAQPASINDLGLSNIVESDLNYLLDDSEEPYQEISQQFNSAEILSGPVPKTTKVAMGSGASKWVRDPKMASKALSDSSHLCEVDSQHLTFIHPKTRKNFVEAHHFIPMEYQDEFEVSIDVPENILSLCPNCHRMFHHADNEAKNELIDKFYALRKKVLMMRGIDVSIESVRSMYY